MALSPWFKSQAYKNSFFICIFVAFNLNQILVRTGRGLRGCDQLRRKLRVRQDAIVGRQMRENLQSKCLRDNVDCSKNYCSKTDCSKYDCMKPACSKTDFLKLIV